MLEVKNLKKSFGNRVILDNVNLTVKDGEILSIVGPSGAGKTTLLRCITGLETADSGQFLIDGQAFDPQGNEETDRVIGVVFQDYNLFPNLSVMENITLAPTMVLKKDKATAEKEAKELLDELGLDDKGSLYPYQLSGGQKQRVAIARALAMKPKILCYDEPTSALDPTMRKEVAKIILGLKKDGMTQLVVTHDFTFADTIADDILKVKALDKSLNQVQDVENQEN
ncbi:amino acid ABC transporter ATP-binding protein [Limosilactobacillus viscerum]|uniref:amino acid ABC transporter ATP-binding protein n=1 Tax=Limosilactobacillus viscerum TaxID=2993450 RepID=UPI0024B9C1DC|nr:amino acid ABC transporter ATP-binding protein [Limosilactobacillus viscerum]